MDSHFLSQSPRNSHWNCRQFVRITFNWLIRECCRQSKCSISRNQLQNGIEPNPEFNRWRKLKRLRFPFWKKSIMIFDFYFWLSKISMGAILRLSNSCRNFLNSEIQFLLYPKIPWLYSRDPKSVMPSTISCVFFQRLILILVALNCHTSVGIGSTIVVRGSQWWNWGEKEKIEGKTVEGAAMGGDNRRWRWQFVG